MCLGGGLQVTQKVQTSGDVAGRIKPCMKLIRANMLQASVYKQLPHAELCLPTLSLSIVSLLSLGVNKAFFPTWKSKQ